MTTRKKKKIFDHDKTKKKEKKPSFEYQYVFVSHPSGRESERNVLGAKDLDALLSLTISSVIQADENLEFKAFTKEEADKIGLKPNVVCVGKA